MNLDELLERVKGHTPGNPDDPPTCANCGDEYSLREGNEITDYCDLCAQELAPSLLTLAVEQREQISAVLRICSGEDQVECSEDDAVLKAIERILKGETTNV